MGSLVIQPNSRRAFVLAAALLVGAAAAQWLLRLLVQDRLPYLFFLAAVGIAAMFGGWRPALVVMAGGLVNALWWLPPFDSFAVSGTADRVSLAVYLVAANLLVVLGGRLSQLRARAAQAEQNLGEQVRDLQSLHELSSRIALLPGLNEQLQAVLQTLGELHGAHRALMVLRPQPGGALQPVAQVGYGTLDALADAGACAQAFAERRTVILQDTEDAQLDPARREQARRHGFRAVHARPLMGPRGEPLGALSVSFARPCLPDAREDRIAELCARMAAVLTERETALQQARSLSRRLEVALDSSAVPFCLVQPLRDEAGKVRTFRWEYLNAAAASLLRRPAADLVGRPVRDSLTGAALDTDLLPRALEALSSGRTQQFETWADAGGTRYWFHAIASPHDGGLAVWFADISARKQQEQALRDADRRKDEFLATLAHELRNPLAPIRQAAAVAKAAAATEAQKRWSMDVIERQVAHMAMLLDDLLDVSRITRGKLALRRLIVPVSQVFDSALEASRPLIERRRQSLQVRLPADPLWLDADPLRMAQVLSNLLGNAAKYTPEEGRIELSARLEDGQVRIDLSDNGMGIAPDALEGIFEMFTQERGRHDGAEGGLGIGLALSRGLVELHGGRLTAASEGVGRGSTFTIRLPAATAPAPAPSAAPPPPPPAAAGARFRRVLVADDNRDAAQSLADLLRMEGHEVTVAFDGNEALDQFTRFSPEVALLDIGMPGMTGNQVASAIRARPEGASTLLVAITGWGQERDRSAAREAGFDHHFTKPVDPGQVLRLLETSAPETADRR